MCVCFCILFEPPLKCQAWNEVGSFTLTNFGKSATEPSPSLTLGRWVEHHGLFSQAASCALGEKPVEKDETWRDLLSLSGNVETTFSKKLLLSGKTWENWKATHLVSTPSSTHSMVLASFWLALSGKYVFEFLPESWLPPARFP